MHHVPVIVEQTEILVEPAPDTLRDRNRPIRTVSASGRRRRGVAFWPVLGSIPVLLALGAAGAAVRQTATMRRRRRAGILAGVGTAGALALGGAVRWQMARWFTPEPGFRVEEKRNGIEVRRYPAMVVAETTVAGLGFEDAVTEGFRRLAGYIGGDNATRESIPMHAPVEVRQVRGDELTSSAEETVRRDELAFTISFAMPTDRSRVTLPVPDDVRVRIQDVPERRVAVLRGMGGVGAASTRAKEQKLLEKVTTAGIVPAGRPTVAFYDPPTTLPFLRRVEACVQVV